MSSSYNTASFTQLGVDHCGERTPRPDNKRTEWLGPRNAYEVAFEVLNDHEAFSVHVLRPRIQEAKVSSVECANEPRSFTCRTYPLLLEVEDEPLDQGAALLQFDILKLDVDLFECVLVRLL